MKRVRPEMRLLPLIALAVVLATCGDDAGRSDESESGGVSQVNNVKSSAQDGCPYIDTASLARYFDFVAGEEPLVLGDQCDWYSLDRFVVINGDALAGTSFDAEAQAYSDAGLATQPVTVDGMRGVIIPAQSEAYFQVTESWALAIGSSEETDAETLIAVAAEVLPRARAFFEDR